MALTRIPLNIAFAGFVVAALALNGCKGDPAHADDADPAAGARAAPPISLPVVGAPVRKGDLVLSVATTGQVRAAAVAHLKAETAGTVEEVLVHPGDRVHRGQPLVKLDPRPFDLAVEDAEAQVAAARVSYQDNIVPDSLVTGHAPTAERRANALARSGLQGAQVNLEKAKLDRERATITAPFDGVVDEVNVADGERVGVGGDIATVVDIDNLRIEAAVLEHDLPLIRRGGDALVIPAATPDHPLHGTITAILPLVDSTTRAGRALVRVRNNGVLRPGMYADVRLESTRLPNRVLVPAPAIIERDGRPLVFVVKKSHAEWTYVNPGRSNGVDTEILPDSSSGEIPVQPGDTVLVEGHLTLTHDAPVRLVSDSAGS